MLHFLELLVIVGGILTLAFMVLLAMPQSKLRDLLMPFISWAFVVLCGVYVISPVDIMPEILLGPAGIFDDLAAGVAGVVTAVSTIKAHRKKHPHFQDPYFNN